MRSKEENTMRRRCASKQTRQKWIGLAFILGTILVVAAFSGTAHLNPGAVLNLLHISQGTCSSDSETLDVNCDLGALKSGGSATVQLLLTPSRAAIFIDCATAAANERDLNRDNNTACARTKAFVLADLAIVKSHAPGPAAIGRLLTYTVTVINRGPSPATDVTLVDRLPITAGLGTVTSSQGSCSTAHFTLTCRLGNLAVGATALVTITVTPNSHGAIKNQVCVSGSEPDPVSGNDCATDTVEVPAPPPPPVTDVSVTKTCHPPVITLGQSATCTITVTNRGPDTATGVKLSDTRRDP